MPLRFRDEDPYIFTPALNLNSNTVTITAWVKGHQDADFTGIFFCRGGTTVAGINVHSGKLRYHWNDLHWDWDSGLVVPVDTWTFVALVISATQAVMYVDGSSATNVDAHAVEAFDAASRLAMDSNDVDRMWVGMVDDVRIHNATLTPAQIATLRTTGVSPASLIHHWKLDESSGTTATDSTGSADGTLKNAPVWRPNQGHDGGAVMFDTVSNYVDFGASPGSAAALTVCFWAEAAKQRYQIPVDKHPSAGSAGWVIRFQNNGDIWFRVGSEADNEELRVVGAYAVGVRAHYAFTFSGNTGKMYKNGVLIGTKTDFTNTVNDVATVLRIGRPSVVETGEVWDGLLEDVRIYDDVLTLEEIAEIVAGQGLDMNMRTLAHLVLRAPLRGQTDGRADGADSVKDFSPNGYDGTPAKWPRYVPGFVRLAR